MSKVAKIAAVVVGIAAVVFTGGVAIFGATAVAGFLGGALGITVSVGAIATIGTVLAVASTVLAAIAGVTAKKPKVESAGQQMEFRADPTAGIPYVLGYARVGEDIVHQAAWGDKNRYLGIVGVISGAGPIQSYDGFYADNTLVTFSGGNATGYYHDFISLQTQLGARPEGAALTMSGMPNWGAAYKLSSMAAAGLILTADVDKGKVFSGGTPQFTHQVHGVKVYDARADSTNGGSGAQRALDETTYVYSDNPWTHAATYALGRWQNGVKIIGPGMPPASIDWASHIEAANLADLQGWTISGKCYSTDRKWEVLKAMGQAGGGYPVPSGTKLACLLNTPRVSLETINESDLRGPVNAPQMSMRRDRLNGAIPRYREPTLGWQMVPADEIRSAAYLTEDGGKKRTREIEFPFVIDKDQAAQLAAYEVANTRERTGITLQLNLYWSQFKVGDCLTLNIPKARLYNQKCIVIGRRFDPDSNSMMLTFRTEDDAKHTWALGVTGTPPADTDVSTPPGTGDIGGNLSTILRSSYARGLASLTSSDAGSSATIHIFGSGGTGTDFFFEYATPTPQEVTWPYADITGLAYSTQYYVYADVDAVGDATPVYGATTVYADALNSASHPDRVFLNQTVTTPAAGSPPTTGGGEGGGYGGCVAKADTLTIFANETKDGPGVIRCFEEGDLGSFVWTQHETTRAWGAYRIAALEFVERPVFKVGLMPRASEHHRFGLSRDDWTQIETLEGAEPDGTELVVKAMVEHAHTYISKRANVPGATWVLSHNLKPLP